MKFVLMFLLFVGSVSVASAASFVQPFTANNSQLTATAASAFQIPAVKGRTGSHRVGGTNSHGKHSRYVGGHK